MMNLEKTKVRASVLICFFAVIIWVAVIIWMGYAIRRDAPFACFSYDQYGNRRNAFFDEKNQTWYMFVGPADEIDKLSVGYTGMVIEASSGKINRYLGRIQEPQLQNTESLELKLADGTTQTIIVKQSNLPEIHIVLPGATVEMLHADKAAVIKGASVYIMDASEENVLISTNNVAITGRGNSTWEIYEKKGYVLEFGEAEPLLSMEPARKWVLLANASDDSMIRNYLTYQVAKQMDMPFSVECAYADLWINGDYRGTYLISEKAEIGDNRLPLKSQGAVLIEQDESVYPDGVYRVLQEEAYPFYSGSLDKYFSLKQTSYKNSALIPKSIASFNQQLDELMEYLRITIPSDVTLEKLNTMIDVDSVLKYYLISEYTLNCEAYVSSFFWYQDGPDDIIHLGPIWDYDTCMGNDGSGYTDSYAHNHDLFRYMLAAPVVYERVCQMWDTYRPVFENMEQIAKIIREHIQVSAEMNYLCWDVLGKETTKTHATPFAQTHSEAVDNVCDWLSNRSSYFSPQQYSVINSAIVPEWNTMNIAFECNQPYDALRFAVWSEVGGQDDLHWYEAEQDARGVWRSRVNLENHSGSGKYHIHACINEGAEAVAGGWTLIKTAPEEGNGIFPGIVHAIMTRENGVDISFLSETEQNQLRFAVWSKADGQDDLRWYEPRKDDNGIWRSHVDLWDHSGPGNYYIHVYADGISEVIAGKHVLLEQQLGNDPN